MRTIPLFPEPLDLDDVYRCLGDDDFFSCAFFFLGFHSTWRAGLEQTARLLGMAERADREWRPIYRVVSLLIQRAETFDNTSRLLDEVVAALEILPAGQFAFLQEIKMAHLHKVDPLAYTREKNKAWLEAYRHNWHLLALGSVS